MVSPGRRQVICLEIIYRFVTTLENQVAIYDPEDGLMIWVAQTAGSCSGRTSETECPGSLHPSAHPEMGMDGASLHAQRGVSALVDLKMGEYNRHSAEGKLMKDDEPWWNIQIWASLFSVCHGCHGQKLVYFSHGHPPIGDEQLGKASALRRDVGKEEPRGVLSSGRVQGGKLQSFQVPPLNFMDVWINMFRWGQRFLGQELKDIEQKSQFHPVSKPFSSHVHLIFIQWLLVTSDVLAGRLVGYVQHPRGGGVAGLYHMYIPYTYIYMLCICIYIY